MTAPTFAPCEFSRERLNEIDAILDLDDGVGWAKMGYWLLTRFVPLTLLRCFYLVARIIEIVKPRFIPWPWLFDRCVLYDDACMFMYQRAYTDRRDGIVKRPTWKKRDLPWVLAIVALSARWIYICGESIVLYL